MAQPDSEEFWVTNTGYIPVTSTGYDHLKADAFFQKPQNVGREVALASLLVTEPTPLSRGLRSARAGWAGAPAPRPFPPGRGCDARRAAGASGRVGRRWVGSLRARPMDAGVEVRAPVAV